MGNTVVKGKAQILECTNGHRFNGKTTKNGGVNCPFCELRDEVYESLVGSKIEVEKEFGETRGALRIEMEDMARTIRGEQAAVARELRQDITLIKDKVDRFIGKRTDFTELSFTDPLQAMAWATAPEHRMIEVVCEEDPKADGGLVYIARRV